MLLGIEDKIIQFFNLQTGIVLHTTSEAHNVIDMKLLDNTLVYTTKNAEIIQREIVGFTVISNLSLPDAYLSNYLRIHANGSLLVDTFPKFKTDPTSVTVFTLEGNSQCLVSNCSLCDF